MMNLREFARQDAGSSTAISSFSGYSKEGKRIETPVEQRTLQRWGIWAVGTGYFDGRNVSGASMGVDYRISDHWLIGGYANWWYNRQSVFAGGLYTSWYQKGWWTVLGGEAGFNNYAAFGSMGYDFTVGSWLIGPVASVQYNNDTVNLGYGTGQLIQPRIGFRVQYAHGRFQPFSQVMYQYQGINNITARQNGLWFDLGAFYQLTDRWSLFGDWNFEGNGHAGYQIYQVNAGLRMQF